MEDGKNAKDYYVGKIWLFIFFKFPKKDVISTQIPSKCVFSDAMVPILLNIL